MNPESNDKKRVCEVIAAVIRKKSREGELVISQELFQHLKENGFQQPSGEGQCDGEEVLIREVLQANEDLREISGEDGIARYHSTQFMTESYAGILLRREGDLIEMMAEIVRENSRIYPRPVPMALFKDSPFDLGEGEIEECLTEMGQREGFSDIARTTTSIGTIFLYSTHYLDPGHASMLAEWLDVGQAANP